MKFNSKIIEILKECKIHVPDGMTYLLSLYHSLDCTYFPPEFKVKMNTTGIYVLEKGTLKWVTPLTETQLTAFEWVINEYIPLFERIGKPPHTRECVSRFKKFFAENPEVRKDDVMEATLMYIKNTEPKYVMFPHYFIQKGVGSAKTQTILDWIEKVKISQQQQKNRVSNSNILQ